MTQATIVNIINNMPSRRLRLLVGRPVVWVFNTYNNLKVKQLKSIIDREVLIHKRESKKIVKSVRFVNERS